MNMFQADSGFLEELTGGGGMQQQQLEIGMENSMVAQNVTVGMQPPQTSMSFDQMNPMVNQSMQQQSQMQQYNNFDTNNYGSQGGMNQMQQPQGGGGQEIGLMSPNNQYMNPQINQGQIQSPPPQQGNYQNYTMQNNACMTPPRQHLVQSQQMALNHSPMWHETNNSQTSMPGTYMSDMQQQPENSAAQPAFQNNQITTNDAYMSQHDYAMPTNTTPQAPQRLSHFPDNQSMQTQQQPNMQTQGMQQLQQNKASTFQMNSPPQATRLAQMSANNTQGIVSQQQQAGVVMNQENQHLQQPQQQNLQTIQVQMPASNMQVQNNSVQFQNAANVQQGTMQAQNVRMQNVQHGTGVIGQQQVVQMPQSNIRHLIARGANGQPIRIQQIQGVQGTPNIIRLQQVNVNQGNQQQQFMIQQPQGVNNTQRLTHFTPNQNIQLANIGQQQGQTFIISQAPMTQNTQGTVTQNSMNPIRIVSMNGSVANLAGVQVRPVYTNASTVAMNQPALAASNRPQMHITSQGVLQQIRSNVQPQQQQPSQQSHVAQTNTASVMSVNNPQMAVQQQPMQQLSVGQVQIRPQGTQIQVRPQQMTQIQVRPSQQQQSQIGQLRPQAGVQVAQVHMQQAGQQQQSQQQNIPLKIQQLTQQLAQLRSAPLSADKQQKIMDLQEHIRNLKAQQNMMQQQRPQQQTSVVIQQQPTPQKQQQSVVIQQQVVRPQTAVVQQQHPVKVIPTPQKKAPQQQTVVRLQTPQKAGVKQPIILPQGSQLRPGTTLIIRQPTAQGGSTTAQQVTLNQPVRIQGQQVRIQGQQVQQVRLQGNQVSLIRGTTSQMQPQTGGQMQVVRIVKPGDITPVTSGQLIVKKLPSVKLAPKKPDSQSDHLDVESSQDGMSGRSSPADEPTGAQAKANKIIQEAIAKAEAEGRPIPKVVIAEETGTPEKKKSPKKKKESKQKKEIKPKEKTLKIMKPKSAKKKKAIPFSFKKKKKKNESSEDEDVHVSPPQSSEEEEEDGIEKRRSGRHSKRKRYKDEIDLGISDDGDDDTKKKQPALLKQVQFFAENPPEDEAQVVEKILAIKIVKKPVLKMIEEVKEIKPAEGPDQDVDIMGDENVAGEQEVETDQTETVKTGEKDDSVSTREPLKVNIEVEESEKTDVDPALISPTGREDRFSQLKSPTKDSAIEYADVEQFYVKYKNFSYLHCEWKTAAELERGDKRISLKIRNWKKKKASLPDFNDVDDGEYFNPDYCEVDRVLEMSVTPDPDTRGEATHYLVKWCALPYEDSTWELEQDVPREKVDAFLKFKELPDEDDRQVFERPMAKEWKSLEKSKTYKNNNVVRDYQLEGINWLTFCYYNKNNCILADEMGLGKTIQSITFLQEIYNYGIRGPFLIIVPLSTIGNWQREFGLWTDMNVVVYHGTTPSRIMIQEYEMYYKNEEGFIVPGLYRFHALITTFEIIISDCEILSQIDWRLTIIDEAHRLKNQKCKLMEGLKLFELEHKVLLTGTPLQNNVEELFSLLHFLEPKQFCSSEAFLADFGDLRSEGQVEKLKAILKPMMLRRLKEDVEKSLAPKEETIVEVELTNIQKKYYRAILERNFSYLSKGGTSTNVPNLMNTMMELRKCCNHPYLINGAEEKILDENKENGMHLNLEQCFKLMIQAAGKLVLVDKLLPKLKAGKHKVLIFSQMIRVLDILEDYLIHKRYLYERIDGRITGNLRQEAIDRFSKPESDRFVFLLCTRAGGLGINLTAADTVIIYDSDWNPQNDLQAQARCHRIGQKKSVQIYRLITRNTYEREMFDKASLKLGLDKAVLQSMGSKELQKNDLSKKEIEDLLKKGAYGALMEDDEAGDDFCEEDIDKILQQRTQVIQLEGGEKGSTFAKATFSTSATRSDIDIDDPAFWDKWAKKADFDVEAMNNKSELIMELPRNRKQTARYTYGGDKDMYENMSELDSSGGESDEGKGKKGGRSSRRRKNQDEEEGAEGPFDYYTRNDCFKVEKNLLHFGWGRWQEIVQHSRFKRKLLENDVITLTKAILLYSLQQYAGDEHIKGFIYDLIMSSGDSDNKALQKHAGLSAPVPRGRKGKQAKIQNTSSELDKEMATKIDIDADHILSDEGYKKHLKRHANKILLRVRMLYYLRHEVIGDQEEGVFAGARFDEIDMPPPYAEGPHDPPIFWWDEAADRSLLVGTFKHGYEKYALMRNDPGLSFLTRCGAPDATALAREINDDFDAENLDLEGEEGETPVRRTPTRRGGRGRGRRGGGRGRGGRTRGTTSQIDRVKQHDGDESMSMDEEDDGEGGGESRPMIQPPESYEEGKLPWPISSDINTRLRRIIAGYQRKHKIEQQRQEHHAKKLEKREKFESIMKEKERMRQDARQRWSRREEVDFYRTVSTFGVERDKDTGEFRWETFRNIARLDKKYDHTLTDYFKAFYYMCKRVCKLFRTEEEARPPNDLFVEFITEERASRCLARIDLLNRIREKILWHEKLEERLSLCQPSPELPDWWKPGEHDKDLLIGAAKHGLSRTDIHILHDPKLCFSDIAKRIQKELSTNSGKYFEAQAKSESVITSAKTEDAGAPKSEVKTEDEEVKSGFKNENSDIKPDISDTKSVCIKPDPSDVKRGTSQSTVKTETDVKAESADNEETMECDKKEVPGNDTNEEDSGSADSNKKSPVKHEKASTDKLSPVKDTDDDLEEGEIRDMREGAQNGPLDRLQKMFPGAQIKDEMDEDIQGSQDMMTSQWINPALMWPKDRVVFSRLENVCHCVENGEWPKLQSFVRYDGPGSMSDSRSNTPVPSGLSRSNSEYFVGGVNDSMGEGSLKLTIHKKKRGRKSRAELEAEQYARLREMGVVMSDPESESAYYDEDGSLSGIEGGENQIEKLERLVRKRNMLEAAIGNEDSPAPKRRAWSPSMLDPDMRVPVINREDGSVLVGEKAPKAQDLPKWLEEHPTWMAARVDLPENDDHEEREHGHPKKFRRGRLDPGTLELDKLTGEENVWVVNRDTGKRITGAKAPPLKHLLQWLERNPTFDVDPKWAHLIKAKKILPEDMQHRILMPRDGRGRKPGVPNATGTPVLPPGADAATLQQYYAQLQQAYASQMGAMTGKLPMAYGNMSTLAAMNPMYAAQLAQYGMLTGITGTGGDEEREEGEITKKDKEKLKKSALGGSPSSSSSPAVNTQAAALSQMYSQMMMNQMYAQYANMSALPGGATSYASLAAQMQAQQAAVLMNGNNDSEEEGLVVKQTSKRVKDISDGGSRSKALSSPPMDSHKLMLESSKMIDAGRRRKATPKHIDKIQNKAHNLAAVASLPHDLSVKSASTKPAKVSHSQDLPQDLSVKPPLKDDQQSDTSSNCDSPHKQKKSGRDSIVQDLSVKKLNRTEDENSNESMDLSRKTSESDAV